MDTDCKPVGGSAGMSMVPVPVQPGENNLGMEVGTFHLVVVALSFRTTSYDVSTAAAKRMTFSYRVISLSIPPKQLICISNTPFLTLWWPPTLLLYQRV